MLKNYDWSLPSIHAHEQLQRILTDLMEPTESEIMHS